MADQGRFGWREGLLLGAVVLVVVYVVAAFTEWLPPLRDALQHTPVTIGLLVVVTIALLLALLRPRRG